MTLYIHICFYNDTIIFVTYVCGSIVYNSKCVVLLILIMLSSLFIIK